MHPVKYSYVTKTSKRATSLVSAFMNQVVEFHPFWMLEPEGFSQQWLDYGPNNQTTAILIQAGAGDLFKDSFSLKVQQPGKIKKYKQKLINKTKYDLHVQLDISKLQSHH